MPKRTDPQGKAHPVRHVLSLLLGLVIAPVVWIGAGLGQAKLAQAAADGVTLNSATVPLAILAGAGLVFGLIAVTRISPLGPILAGLLLIGVQLAYVARAERITELLPKRVAGAEGVLTLPAATGLAAVLGAALLFAVLSVARWRRWPKYDQPEDTFLSDSATPIGSPTPAGARKSYEPVGAPAEESTRAFAGSPSGADPGRHEPYGYASDEPTRTVSSWPEAPAPKWHAAGNDSDETERTTRLPAGAPSAESGAGGPWGDSPRR